jgi:phospholipid/cholesterol/gamma-HCH transport system substrate-binding protein
VLIGLLCVAYMTVKLGKVPLWGDNYNTFYARFGSVSGLRVGSPVEVFGIEAGQVERLTIDSEKELALVELKVKKSITLYDDATAAIKTAGLIGDKFIKIEPGGGGDPLKAGGTITETTSPTDLEDLISKYAFGDVKKDDKKETK